MLKSSPLVQSLLKIRTTAYQLASPFEGFSRRLKGGERLPPLWLRRHTGAPSRFVSAAEATADMIERLELLPKGSNRGLDGRILDIGCGCGAMALTYRKRLSPSGRYIGFDVHEPSVDWCRTTFAADERFSFHTAVVDSPYTHRSGQGAEAVTTYRFPAADASIDLALAKSVFTHLTTDDVRHYLGEIGRVLSSTGFCFATFFLFEGEDAQTPLFPHPDEASSTMRWRRKWRPHAAIAFESGFIKAMIAEAGLGIVEMIPGFWPGQGPRLTGQDQLILKKL